MKITLAGLVLFFLVLMACLAGNRSLQARLETAQAEVQKVQDEIKSIEQLGGLAKVEKARAYLKGAADWRALEVWWKAQVKEQRQRLRTGNLDWSHS